MGFRGPARVRSDPPTADAPRRRTAAAPQRLRPAAPARPDAAHCQDAVRNLSRRTFALPPPGSPPFVWILQPCFNSQGGFSTIENETYMYYIQLRTSQTRHRTSSSGTTTATEQTMLADFKRLWATNFLDDLSIEVTDHTFPNGTVGKIVTYHMEERERIKIVDYRDTDEKSISIIKRTDIDEKLRERSIELRLDSFRDDGTIRRVEGVLRELMAEKGFTNAEVSHRITPVAGGPKLINVTFVVGEGPKLKIRDVEFVGNEAISDGKLQKRIKENKPKNPFYGWISGGGTYKEAEFEEDAAKIVEYYQNSGYPQARVGQPEVKTLEDSKDGKTALDSVAHPRDGGRALPLRRLCASKGTRWFAARACASLYHIEAGEWYNRKKLQDGNKKAQEIYGGAGYMEFTPFPMLTFSDDPNRPERTLAAQVPASLAEVAAPPPSCDQREAREAQPTVDITMRIDEGPQYFVNRITFTGNTTTRDNVIRREMRLVEGGVFNTEALKYSVRRLNQLGYFKELKGDDRDMKVDKTPDQQNTVDVTLKFEEQNRNQLTFGAGVSQYRRLLRPARVPDLELPRPWREPDAVGAGGRSRAELPAGVHRAIPLRPQHHRRLRHLQPVAAVHRLLHAEVDRPNLVFGFPVADFTRMFMNYSFEKVKMTDLNEALFDTSCILRPTGCSTISSVNDLSQLTPTQIEVLRRNPFVYDSLLIGQGGERSVSKVTPSFVHNTVDNPIFPNTGKRLTASIDLAVLGGNTQFYKPRARGDLLLPPSAADLGRLPRAGSSTSRRSAKTEFLCRSSSGCSWAASTASAASTSGPSGRACRDRSSCSAGTRACLFNAEYLISIMSQVRIVAFFDAGQVQDFGEPFSWMEPLLEVRVPNLPPLTDPFATSSLVDPSAPGAWRRSKIGRTHAFKTSTGVELRFFMPVLNVPFRLIYAWNPSRGGVLDNNLQPAKSTVFRFAVGTTF